MCVAFVSLFLVLHCFEFFCVIVFLIVFVWLLFSLCVVLVSLCSSSAMFGRICIIVLCCLFWFVVVLCVLCSFPFFLLFVFALPALYVFAFLPFFVCCCYVFFGVFCLFVVCLFPGIYCYALVAWVCVV